MAAASSSSSSSMADTGSADRGAQVVSQPILSMRSHNVATDSVAAATDLKSSRHQSVSDHLLRLRRLYLPTPKCVATQDPTVMSHVLANHSERWRSTIAVPMGKERERSAEGYGRRWWVKRREAGDEKKRTSPESRRRGHRRSRDDSRRWRR